MPASDLAVRGDDRNSQRSARSSRYLPTASPDVPGRWTGELSGFMSVNGVQATGRS